MLSVITATVLSCGPSLPLQPQMPDITPPPMLGVDSIVPGPVVYRCGDWFREVETTDGWAILDLVLPRPTPDDPEDHPRAAYVSAFADLGAVVIHEFNFAAIRAVLPISAVESLWPEALDYALGVPYSDRFDMQVALVFSGGDETDWRALLEAAGGRLEIAYPDYSIGFGVMPDTAAPAVRAHPLVSSLELNRQMCGF